MRVHIIRSTGDVIVPCSSADFTVEGAIATLKGHKDNLQVQLSQGNRYIIATASAEYGYVRVSAFTVTEVG